VLYVRELCAGYGKLQVLSDVSLSVESGEFVAVLGPNGAGKTTLMETISGLIRPTKGRVEFAGADLTALPTHVVVSHGVVLVPQGRRIFGPLSVQRNLELGALAAGRSWKHAISCEQADLVFRLFPRLAERREQAGGTLSGGEQQMLAIGRALMARPRLLLLDEPSLGLAPKVVDDIFESAWELSQTGIGIVLVEQNAAMALELAARVYVLNVGRVVRTDTAERLANDPHLSAMYLGGAAAG
jgi:branched-chain amino acid transport system ATP-binding protein